MSFKMGEGITLRDYLSLCLDDQGNESWMICQEVNYTLDMLVYPVVLDNWDISPEEYEKIEYEVLSQGDGYGNLISCDQLMDILDVLKDQKPNYTEKDLEESLNYYSENDTFLELKSK